MVLQESMKMMGLSNWLHWVAWFTKYLLFLLITVSIMTLFLCVSTPKGPVIGKTSPAIVFLFLFVYAMCSINFCFAISVFFQKGLWFLICFKNVKKHMLQRSTKKVWNLLTQNWQLSTYISKKSLKYTCICCKSWVMAMACIQKVIVSSGHIYMYSFNQNL